MQGAGPSPGSGRRSTAWDSSAFTLQAVRVWVASIIVAAIASYFLLDRSWLLLAGPAVVGLVGLAVVLRMPWLPVCLLLISMPVLGQRLPGGFLVLHLLGLAAGAAVLIGAAVRREGLSSSPVIWAAALVLLGMLMATLVSKHPLVGLRQVLLYVIGLALLVAVIQSGTDQTGPLWIVRSWIVGFMISVLPHLRAPAPDGVEQGGGVVRGRLEGIFTQPNYLGELCLLTMFLSISLALSARKRGDRLLSLAGLISSALAMALTLSRGTFIGMFVAVAVLCLLIPRLIPRLAGWFAFAVVLLGMLWAVGNQFVSLLLLRLGSISEAETNPTDSRQIIWGEAIRLWSENQWFGLGPGGYLRATQSAGSLLAPAGAWHAHNVILHVGVETGLVGMATVVIAALLILGTALAAILGQRIHPTVLPREGVAALLAGLFGAAGHGAVDFVYSQPVLLALLGVYLGVLGAGCQPRRDSRGMETGATDESLPTSRASADAVPR